MTGAPIKKPNVRTKPRPKGSNTQGQALERRLDTLQGIGPKRTALLAAMGLHTMGDVLFHFPRAYQDRREFTPIAKVSENEHATIRGKVVSARMIRLRGRMNLAEVTLKDDTGEIKATWFGRGFMAKSFAPDTEVILSGVVGKYKGLALKNPDYEILTNEADDVLNTGRIVPVYRLTDGVTQRMLRRWVHTALDEAPGQVAESLPKELLKERGYPSILEALNTIHYPESLEATRPARDRFAYEELLAIQVAVLRGRSARRNEAGLVHVDHGERLTALRESLPYTLTSAQDRAIEEVIRDMTSRRPMMRLIQGDVGCGKTIVAAHAIAAAIDGGYQAALMAPTEILAEQHGKNLKPILEPLGISVTVLTGSTADASKARDALASGSTLLAIGTHALFQESTRFQRLGLAIVDEQHRFGVLQRSKLTEKGLNPDILQMTATPIPRTLVMTLYGGLDISVIDEMPPGRLPVDTRTLESRSLSKLYGHIVQRAEEGFQTYFICPLVEESDKRDLKAAVTHFESLSKGPLKSLRTALIHGRLPSEEKEVIMRRFEGREIDVLFSTSVIEVGIDVPAATTMVIEDAWQFGLTQLHQLRGRIGRGTEQSHCFLLGKPNTPEGRRRIEVMCRTSDGFEIAEEDLQLRGPGEMVGVRQAGLSDLRAADLVKDARLLAEARQDAEKLLKSRGFDRAKKWAPLRKRAAHFEKLLA